LRYRITITAILIIILVFTLISVKFNDTRFLTQSSYIKSSQVIWDRIEQAEISSPDSLIKKAKFEGYFKGISFYPAPLPYNSEEAGSSLTELLKLPEVNAVEIRFFLYQYNLYSTNLLYDTHQEYILQEIIGRIHHYGKMVCLEPQIFIKTPEQFVANIKPHNVVMWFTSYKRIIDHYAKFANENNVELFSIANENASLWQYEEQWNEIIDSVREQYNGRITVKLNCWWQEESFKKVLHYDWLSNKNLDYIGFSPYFDLTSQKASSIEELIRAWTDSRYNRHGLNIEKELEAISQKFQKKILFLEIGYRTIKNCTIEPWNSAEVVPQGSRHKVEFSEKESVLAIKALNKVFKKKSWLAGIFWFYWGTTKSPPRDTSWNIRGKDSIMKQIREGFKEE